MNEQVKTFFSPHAKGMAGLEDHRDGAIYWGTDIEGIDLGRNDGEAFAHHALSKGLIGDLGERHDGSLERGAELHIGPDFLCGERIFARLRRRRSYRCRAGAQLLVDLVKHELHGGAHDDLHVLFGGVDDAGNPGALDSGVIDKRAILHTHAQAGGAVVQGIDIVLAAETLDDAGGGSGGLIIACGGIVVFRGVLVIAAARGLQVKPADEVVEYNEIQGEENNAHN